MSCPDEATWMLYVDGETEEADRRGLDSHLVGCRDCRQTVVLLRDETTLLGDVLQERERAVRAPARAPAPEPGIALGLPAAIAAATLAVAAVGYLLETRVPGGLDHLNPLRLKGATEMVFDLIFLARDRVPGLLELGLSIGALASLSAVLTLGVNVVYRRVYGATAALALLAILPAPAEAVRVHLDEDVTIAADEVVDEALVVSGDRIDIAGVIEGDVWVGGERVTISGTVKGNVYTMSRDVELTGTIEGSLHGAIEHTRLEGKVDGNVYLATEELVLGDDAEIGRDLGLVAEDGLLRGQVGRDLVFGGEELELRGPVGRNVDVRWGEGVSLRDGAKVGGDVTAKLEDPDLFHQAAGAEVAGEVSVVEREGMKEHYWDAYRQPRFYAVLAVGLVAGFLFGLLLRWAAPRLMESELSTSPQFFRSLLYGFLVLVATPIAIVALGFTLVGLPIAVLTAFVYVVMVYSAELLVGAWIGRTLLPPREEGLMAWGRSYFVGLAILTVIAHIPFVGVPVTIVATLLGAGLFFEALREAAPS